MAISRETALAAVREELAKAAAAPKCHRCGCLHQTVDALGKAAASIAELAPTLETVRGVLVATKYDCLGCDVCFPAEAVIAFSSAFPDAMAQQALCPTDAPETRRGWPPLPGAYSVVRYGAPVAVCTLNSANLAKELVQSGAEGLAIAGTMRTENLGIERLIRNVLANPNIRHLVLCGEDTRQAIGHLPGQSIEALFAHGVDERQRIVGAKGKRPFLKNVSTDQVRVFRQQVELVPLIGEQNAARVREVVLERHARALPPFDGTVTDAAIRTVRAKEPEFFRSDPVGFFVVYPDRNRDLLVVEHYTRAGVLDCVVEGSTPAAIYPEIVKRRLVSQLDHAAYLGRELATAEHCLRTGAAYVQDRAPGEPLTAQESSRACGASCSSCH